jgi:molecular chaperone IbpA
MAHLSKFDPASFNKALVGFDKVFGEIERRFSTQSTSNYPPFNLIKISENRYVIAIAITGFDKDEIQVELEDSEISIRGHRKIDDLEVEYLHRGLAMRNFEKTFALAEHMKVIKAEMKAGILLITIDREIPEENKARTIVVIEIK